MKWPESVEVGPFPVAIVEVSEDDIEVSPEEVEAGLTSAAMYNSKMLVVGVMRGVGDEPCLRFRVDNDICHELVHAWEDIILAHGVRFTEGETQSLANALHQLLVQVLEANGVEYDGLEIQRTEVRS